MKNSSEKIMALMQRVPSILDEEAICHISAFLRENHGENGEFFNRFGKGDLYYTSFGLACADALGMKILIEKVKNGLKRYDAEKLDLIHLSCYIRTKLLLRKFRLPNGVSGVNFPKIFRRIKETALLEKFAVQSGGYRIDLEKEVTPYAIFLAVTALGNGGGKIKKSSLILGELAKFGLKSGGYSNIAGCQSASLNATTAAMVAIHDCGGKVDENTVDWLWNQFDEEAGGFYAVPGAPIPDLLSTCSALTALSVNDVKISDEKRKKCLGFVMDHWCEDGGFCGNLADGISDCEYTFYGLLSLAILYRNHR